MQFKINNVLQKMADQKELKEIFVNKQHRNIYSNIIKYLSLEDIKNLALLNKSSNCQMQNMIDLVENQKIFQTIFNRRFFDKEKGSLYVFEHMVGPSCSSINNTKLFWKKHFPSIDEGDIIYIKPYEKFIQVISKDIYPNNYYLVRHYFDGKKSFPLNYWQEFGKEHPYRMWVRIHLYYDSLKYWLNKVYPKIKLMGFDLSPNLYKEDELIPVSITFDEDYIYLYYTPYYL